jgi:hypothetical protein
VVEAAASLPAEALFSDGYGHRDYDVMLDLLYGLYSDEEADNVRVFDPFVHDLRRASLITPRMLTQRIEALASEHANA